MGRGTWDVGCRTWDVGCLVKKLSKRILLFVAWLVVERLYIRNAQNIDHRLFYQCIHRQERTQARSGFLKLPE